MNQQQFFEMVLKALEKLEVQYMVAGSVAAVVYGEPMTPGLNAYFASRTYLESWVRTLDLEAAWHASQTRSRGCGPGG